MNVSGSCACEGGADRLGSEGTSTSLAGRSSRWSERLKGTKSKILMVSLGSLVGPISDCLIDVILA